MRILYVSSESPLLPSGGAGTYIAYMARAMQEAGHEVFLLSWTETGKPVRVRDYAPFKPDHVRFETVNRQDIWRETPVPGNDLVFATWLERRLQELVREWRIDVVEATDFFAPALAFFQSWQSRRGNGDMLCVTYNHGFIQDFYAADQIRVPRDVETNLLGERQQCRISDLVIAPSLCARDRLAGYGISGNVSLVREPYVFEEAAGFATVRNGIDYMGRISISKGIDRLIFLANNLHPVHPLLQIKLIGRVVPTPFRVTDMETYLRRRLIPALRDATILTGFLPRASAINLLEPGAICPSLGSAETFSYACIEAIDRGTLPVVRHGTPMAEFFPDHLQDHVLDETMSDVPKMQSQLGRLIERGPEVLAEIQAHCRETLAPARIAEQMGRLYDERLSAKRGRVQVQVREIARPSDVTVLMPVHKPDWELAETIDSLSWQASEPPRVLICDDGTPEDQSEWFEYARARLPDVRIVEQPNAGLLGARNTLIANCETPLAVFLDDDDILNSQFLSRTLEAYNHSPRQPNAVIPQRVNFGEMGELMLRSLLEDHLHLIENDFRMTALIETAVLREIGFDATRRNGEADDWAFWLDFTGRGHVGVLLPEPLFRYRFRKGSMSWPWSEGQHVGTHGLIAETIARMCRHDPATVDKLVKATYAASVRR